MRGFWAIGADGVTNVRSPFLGPSNPSRWHLAKNFHDHNDHLKGEFAAAKAVIKNQRVLGFANPSDLPKLHMVVWPAHSSFFT